MGVALAGGMTLLTALPASAADEDSNCIANTIDDTSYVDGNVAVNSATDGPFAYTTFHVDLVDADDQIICAADIADSANGFFEFEAVPDGEYTLKAKSTGADYPTDLKTVVFTVEGGEYTLDHPILLTPKPSLTGAEVTYSGDLVVGSTLTGSFVTPFAESGVTTTLSWGQGRGESGGPIDDATGNTLVLTEDMVGSTISFIATGTKADYTPTSVHYFSTVTVSAPKKAAAPAPVANSSELSAYLEAHFAPPVGADIVGLPLAGLNPGKDYTANVAWYSGDSFVDVYAYSTATYIGTFPVVNGAVQVNLTSAQLTALGAGAHTLVAVGQSSGGVNSASFTVTAVLASTGFDPMVPMGAAAALLVLGGGLMVLRRRMAAKQ
jgi:hypothetical protein